MKALGVTAYWVDPLNGRPVQFMEELNGQERTLEASEHFHFVVEFKGERLVDHTRHRMDFDSVVIAALIEAANILEQRGHPLIR